MKSKKTTTQKTINLTPTWTAILPALNLLIDSGKQEQRDYVKEQLAILAAAVDASNKAGK